MKKGFTLIELLIVVAIIGILASIIVVTLTDQTSNAQKKKAQFNVAQAVRGVITKHEIAVRDNPDADYECPSGSVTVSGADDDDTEEVNETGTSIGVLYCILDSSDNEFVIFENFKTIGETDANAYCADSEDNNPRKVETDNSNPADDTCEDLD